MAVEGNGRLVVEPGQKGTNGHVLAPRTKAVKEQMSFSVFSIILRYVFYSIIVLVETNAFSDSLHGISLSRFYVDVLPPPISLQILPRRFANHTSK